MDVVTSLHIYHVVRIFLFHVRLKVPCKFEERKLGSSKRSPTRSGLLHTLKGLILSKTIELTPSLVSTPTPIAISVTEFKY